ncbi:hypothetical protein [Verrucomicrobium spinosum]|uniref:hypothetical protein n=1 Tax=Verrucomicrobium spinosum TaxID=2736 RepID=UPI0001746916|nr:hypothetical protein [Verrucomicrobium spinosum]
MKLALLLCLNESRREGVDLAGPMPYDQAVRLHKSVIGLGGGEILPGLPHFALWDSGGGQKVHKMKAGVPAKLPPELKKAAGPAAKLKVAQAELAEARELLEMAEVERDAVISERDAAVKLAEELKVRLETALAERLVQSAPGAGGESGASAPVPPVVPPTSLGPAPAPTSTAPSEPPKTG